MNLKDYVATVPDFPKKGIMFRDVTPIIEDPEAFKYMIDQFADYAVKVGATKIAGPEARGFVLGAAVAYKLGLGFTLIRKPGKLPRKVISEDYSLEYGTNTLCVHDDSFKKGEKVLIIDDLLATGGTALASAKLVERCGASVAGLAFIVDLVDLKGKEFLKNYDVFALLEYEGE